MVSDRTYCGMCGLVKDKGHDSPGNSTRVYEKMDTLSALSSPVETDTCCEMFCLTSCKHGGVEGRAGVFGVFFFFHLSSSESDACIPFCFVFVRQPPVLRAVQRHRPYVGDPPPPRTFPLSFSNSFPPSSLPFLPSCLTSPLFLF